METFKRATLLVVLLTMAALCGFAQTTSVFTAQAGALNCPDHASPYIQYYAYLVEDATPAYVGLVNPNTGQPVTLPDMPNHPIGVDHGCLLGPFVSADGTTGSFNVWQFRTSTGEVIELDTSTIRWTEPSVYPAAGQPATFMMDANIVTVCTVECSNTTGTFHLEGPFSFSWGVHPTTRYWKYVLKTWTNTDTVTVTTVVN